MRTLELRWWIPIALDEPVLTAFADTGRLEARTDLYLLGTGADVGVKRRGDAELLEHKHRLSVAPRQIVGVSPDPIEAIVETWDKTWPARVESASPRWAAIDKLRALRRVGRCRAELTRVSAPGLPSVYATLAIEKQGEASIAAVLAAATALLRADPRLLGWFAQAEPAGYPAWLAQQGARWGSNPQPTG